MRIEIELPDWVDERHIYIMAGVELAAYKEAQETTWHVKTKRCVQCGRCCLNLPKGQYILDENGDCINLIFEKHANFHTKARPALKIAPRSRHVH